MTAKNELLRKCIHMSFLIVPLSMDYVPRFYMLLVLSAGLLIAIFIEEMRMNYTSFAGWFNNITGPLLRNHESSHVTGATYLFLSVLICVLIFTPWVAKTAMLFVIISDALSAIIGKRWGKYKFCVNKTWEGSLVFIISGTAIIVLVPGVPLLLGAAGLLAAFLTDVFIEKIDDNLTIPVFSGIVMQTGYWLGI